MSISVERFGESDSLEVLPGESLLMNEDVASRIFGPRLPIERYAVVRLALATVMLTAACSQGVRPTVGVTETMTEKPTATASATGTATPEPSPAPPPTATAEPTATPDPEPEMLMEENHPLRQEAEGIRESLKQHEIRGATIGVEQVEDRQGNLVDLVVVRERRDTQNIVVHVDGWADRPDKWVVAETVEGTTQVPFIVDDAWAEIPSSLRLQPHEGAHWYVAYQNPDGSIASYFFAWRNQAEVVESDWSMKGLYAATRLKMPDKFERIIWVEPPLSAAAQNMSEIMGRIVSEQDIMSEDEGLKNEIVDAWIEEMLSKNEAGEFIHFTSSSGASLNENYLRQALQLVKTMTPEVTAMVISFDGNVDFWREKGDKQRGTSIKLDSRYLKNEWGSRTIKYLVESMIHELGVHVTQDKIHGYCDSSDNLEHQAYWLQYGWGYREFGHNYFVDDFIRDLIENGSYDTCAG